jgi:hypothetical protein
MGRSITPVPEGGKYQGTDTVQFETCRAQYSELRIRLQQGLITVLEAFIKKKKQTPWSESASELYRPSDRRLSAK